MSARIAVLLVDDHELVRSGLSELIEAEDDLTVCGAVGDSPAAMELVREAHPHVAIVDLMLREGSGIELIKQLKAFDRLRAAGTDIFAKCRKKAIRRFWSSCVAIETVLRKR